MSGRHEVAVPDSNSEHRARDGRKVRPRARRVREGWLVVVAEALGAPPIIAVHLAEAEDEARSLARSWVGPVDVELDVEMPGSTLVHFELVAHLREDALEELDEARGELAEVGLDDIDIDWLSRRAWP